ncbi:hypothetical protein SAMD00019534_018020 [Acytostelium subglobosum LB1]|uniref:hypothetical protein n=1 Tax=Acytostelium subglobosum LB1 TaxID=1410327 RepID=UPI000644DFF7|nr:hypothetical protein SAMD00019534_018020 [Acytostelium subglobosum LB1]GAM18627.1 hypothetical protein SAMD00019534_018020 [Acytostelium subglobosum LB1]|eukprot:XP_012757847.1 hypothetical protein SAMD00019534_018020 [Acytostelium subglobosum LB1]
MADDPTQPNQCTLAVEHDDDEVAQAPNGWAILKSLNPAYPDYPLVDNEVVLGRQPNSTIHFNDMNISGKHCAIIKTSDPGDAQAIAFLYDHSTNGTYIDGIKVGKGNRFLLSNGQEIGLVGKKQGQEKIAFIYHACEKEEEDDGGPQRKYHIGETLGSGNFATVKLAVDKKTGDKFAIKIIDKKKFMMNSSSRKDALMDEVKILQQLNHKNIIHIQEVFDTERTLFLVLELVEGGELLDDILDNCFYKEDKAKEFFRQLVNAVKYLHDQGIAHRDLKPQNILLKHKRDECDDAIKLSDFGLSRTIGEGSFMKTMCGTPQYLAPEILTNGANGAGGYGKEVDCWSMGAILYVMLCGHPPFDDSQDISIFEQIRNAVYEFPDEDWATVSAEAKDLIKRLLTANPSKRYSCNQILEHPWYNKSNTLEALLEKDKENGDRLLGKRKSEDSLLPIQADANGGGDSVVAVLKKSKSQLGDQGNGNSNMSIGSGGGGGTGSNMSIGSTNSNSSGNMMRDDSDTDDENDTKDIKPISPIKSKSSLGSNGNLAASINNNNLSSGGGSGGISTTTTASTATSSSGGGGSGQNSPPVFSVPAPKTPTKELPMCMFGDKCYRKNPQHFKEYRHPGKK